MKKRKTIVFIVPLIILSIYITFYDSIATKPSDAGFWIILALGMSLGVMLSRMLKK